MNLQTALTLLPILFLVNCATTSVTVTCEPPPIPAELLVPCEEPELPADGSFGAVYESYIHNVVGPWSRCVRKDDRLIEITKYRDQVCAKIKTDNEKPKSWWQW